MYNGSRSNPFCLDNKEIRGRPPRTTDFFSTQSLAWDDNSNGELAHSLLEWGGGDGNIYFDESLNITGTHKVVGLLFDPTEPQRDPWDFQNPRDLACHSGVLLERS